ncbi:MAG: hypothetical protein C0506_05410 [Anaerolinea sp.]|nr:hypothetical protein [Anaerolinea sp.]
MTEIAGLRLAPNWTSAAGALEGILTYLGEPLPRHAIMGLSGHAWHTCLATAGGVVALPSGPADLDWAAMVGRYERTGYRWERFAADLRAHRNPSPVRARAIEWATAHLDAGRPLIGWDFHLHEHAIVYGYDRARQGFLVHDILSEEVGPIALWADWPSVIGKIELHAPVEPVELDALESVVGALETALACFAGADGPPDGQPRGTAALDAWADAFDGEIEVDRAGNAYTLAVLQGARMDGAAFLADLAESIPDFAEPLRRAERAVRDEVQAVSPLITLFPFPTGGHGNVGNAGLRRGAAMTLRRAAQHERVAAEAMAAALAGLREG